MDKLDKLKLYSHYFRENTYRKTQEIAKNNGYTMSELLRIIMLNISENNIDLTKLKVLFYKHRTGEAIL
jgi:hypothetical protein